VKEVGALAFPGACNVPKESVGAFYVFFHVS
jgi:hypothetical protein